MKTRQDTTHWLGLVLACGALTFAATTHAGKPVKPPPSSSPAYVPVLLGGLRSSDGRTNTSATDINNAGQLVGETCFPEYPSSSSGQAFLLNPRDVNGDGKVEWFIDQDSDGQNDLICGLGTLPTPSTTSSRRSYANAVNDLGMVVGGSSYAGVSELFIVVPKDTNDDGQPDCWYEDTNGDGFNDLMVPLGRPSGIASSFTPSSPKINNLGQVVGCFYDPNGVFPSIGFLLVRVVDEQGVWQWSQDDGSGGNALMLNLGAFLPKAINDSGQMIGSLDGHATLLNPDGSWIDLTAGDTRYQVTCINNRGQIGLGFYNVDWRAFLLTPTDANADGTADTWDCDANGDGANDLIVDLGTVQGLGNSAIMGLNDLGAAVGVSWRYPTTLAYGPNKRAPFLWRNSGLQTLKDLTSGIIDFSDVYAINQAGQIVCEAYGNAYILVAAH